ncbi:MAG: hypothetical protein NT045_06525 [Candidatus Aureabacteria bacterium]|nr:hypothetical protein [Candidatus Auribacterota bacterium]
MIAIAACAALLPSLCSAAILSLGYATGEPGDSVSVSLSLDPSDYVTNFQCSFRYDTRLLTLRDIYLSDGAAENGISRLWYNDSPGGEVDVETESWNGEWWLEQISRLAIVRFDINENAYSATAALTFVGIAYYERNDDGRWQSTTTQNGAITIISSRPTPTPTPLPGKPPSLTLSMGSGTVLTPGQPLTLSFNLSAQAWDGIRADAYIWVAMPDGSLLYVNPRLEFVTTRAALAPKITIEDMQGDVQFGPVPQGIPYGAYTFYGTLTYPRKSPTKKANRISNTASAGFHIVTPTPTPRP